MNRDALKETISGLIDSVIPENRELTDDDITEVEAQLDDVQDIIDQAETPDEGEEDA